MSAASAAAQSTVDAHVDNAAQPANSQQASQVSLADILGLYIYVPLLHCNA